MSHFYDTDGKPVYQVPNKSKPGTMRGTTLRDMRKLDLAVGVTSINSLTRSVQLDEWKIKETIRYCMSKPFDAMCKTQEDYINEIIEESAKALTKTSDRGKEIHAAMEEYYTKDIVHGKDERYIVPVINGIREKWNTRWSAEETFNYKGLYGGSVDLSSSWGEGDGIVLDFKVKDKDGEAFNRIKGYESYKMQIAAYRVGLGMPNAIGGNVYISSKQPGLFKIELYGNEELDRHFEMFMNLCRYWHLNNKTGRNLNV